MAAYNSFRDEPQVAAEQAGDARQQRLTQLNRDLRVAMGVEIGFASAGVAAELRAEITRTNVDRGLPAPATLRRATASARQDLSRLHDVIVQFAAHATEAQSSRDDGSASSRSGPNKQ